MKILLKYLKPHSKWIVLAIILLITQASCELSLPDYMSRIINQGIIRGDLAYIYKVGIVMLIISLISVIAAVIVGLLASRIAARVANLLRKDVFERVTYFKSETLDVFSSASLMTRTTNDVTQIQSVLILIIRLVFYAPIMGIGGIIKALSKNVSMSWIIALSVGLLIALIGTIMSLTISRFKKIQRFVDQLNLIIRENLSGLLVVRAFHTERFEEKRFDAINSDLKGVQTFNNRAMSFLMPTMMLLMNLTGVLIIWEGAKQIELAALEVGDMIAFMQYTMQIIMSFIMVSVMFILIPRALVSANRIQEVLNSPLNLEEEDSRKEAKVLSGEVTFEDVSFSYQGAKEEVLKHISFTARPGEMTAIIGATGSGKTTLVNLIPRFYEVTSGRILIDGEDIRNMSKQVLRRQIGYIPQKAILFSGTIESNLKYGDESLNASDLMEISRIAQAEEFIKMKKNKLKEEISQGGGNVSGGQKQRLSIARALAKKAPIYIFDDSFSALDFKTDRKLRLALKEKVGEATLLVVAQRISSIKTADEIIVLEEGEMVGKGTHKELMKNSKVYREIAFSQLSKEELEDA